MTGAEIAVCLPDQIHWFSQRILDYYLIGQIDTAEFLRWFHMPNSSYLPAGECIVSKLDPEYATGALKQMPFG